MLILMNPLRLNLTSPIEEPSTPVMVGIRTRFGFVSLLDQDRRGAGTFDLLDTAPFAAVPDEL